MTSWVRAESRVPTSGTAIMSSHSRTTGVDSSSMVAAWSEMICSLASEYSSKVRSPRLSISRENARNSGTRSALSATSSYTASLRENTPSAVSRGVYPSRARAWDSSPSAALSSPAACSSVPDSVRTTRAKRSSSSCRASSRVIRPRALTATRSVQRPTTLSWLSRK
jgi:hypothetical protein